MITVENLKKSYGSHEVLKGISLKVSKGSIYGFLGKNGAGKTTTLNILAGLLSHDGGRIFYKGKDFSQNKGELLKSLGYLPQNPSFYGYMSGEEYLNFMGSIASMKAGECKIRTEELIKTVGLFEARKKQIRTYSGGMKSRLGIAAALYNKPDIVFLDEPTAALDPEGRKDILDLILELKSEGTTVLFSTHILSDVERICDEVSILDQGKIWVAGTIEELLENYSGVIYDLQIDSKEKIQEFINTLSYVKQVEIKENSKITELAIHLEKGEEYRRQLIRDIGKEGFLIRSMCLRKNNLEDIFMKVVKSNE